MNLRWSWDERTRDLFRWVDPDAWEVTGHDPVRPARARVAASGSTHLAADPAFLRFLGEVHDDLAATSTAAAGSRAAATAPLRSVAYFSPEFGIAEALPQYSGGLGVLAGDHLKAASDLGRARSSASACSTATATSARRSTPTAGSRSATPTSTRTPWRCTPVEGVARQRRPRRHAARRPRSGGPTSAGCRSTCSTPTSRRTRPTTAHDHRPPLRRRHRAPAAPGDPARHRRRAGRSRPSASDAQVFHTNEGHAGFLGLERIRRLIVDDGLAFDEAVEAARAGTIFTTHTPVPAGIDRFPRELMERYFGRWADECGVSLDDLMALGHQPDDEPDAPFNMAVMGLRLAGRSNGVSKLHGEVSRDDVRRPLARRARRRGADRLGHQRRARRAPGCRRR